jgi:hypothetical protein
MNESEVQAAAERLRANKYPGPAGQSELWDEYWMNIQKFNDMKMCAEAYLAARPVVPPEVREAAERLADEWGINGDESQFSKDMHSVSAWILSLTESKP